MAKERVNPDIFYRVSYPKTVALITAIDHNKKTNVMTVDWHMPVSIKPPLYAVAVTKKAYTHKLIEESGEFVVNFIQKELAPQAKFIGLHSGKNVDKFKETGLTKEPSDMVITPRIKEAYAHIECKLISTHKTGDHSIFIGEVLATRADPKLLKNDIIDLAEFQPLLHLGKNIYCTTSDYIMRPK